MVDPAVLAAIAPWKHGVVLVVAVAGGFVNSIAGGGSLLTFPTLVWVGGPPVTASATNTVGLWAGSLGGVVGFRRHLPGTVRDRPARRARRWLGGIMGAVLLLRTPEARVRRAVPGAGLHRHRAARHPGDAGETDRPWKPDRRPRTAGFAVAAVLFQFLVGVYGGFFGAGIGIMMLAALAILGLTDIHQMNGLKNLLAIVINGVAAFYFAVEGAVLWTDAGLMALGSVAGGLGGALLAHRLGRRVVRQAVIGIGVAALGLAPGQGPRLSGLARDRTWDQGIMSPPL